MKKFYLLLLGFFLIVLPGRSQTTTNSAEVINYASHFQNIPKGALGLPNFLTNAKRLQIYKQLYAQTFTDTIPENVIMRLERMNQSIEQGGTPKVDVSMLNNKYFRLYSVTDSAKALSVTPEGKLTMVVADESDVVIDQTKSNFPSTDINQLWQIHTTADGKLTIFHANHGAYAQAADSLLTTSTSFTLDSLGYAQFAFSTVNGKLLTATSEKADNTTAWYIVPVESVLLSLEDFRSMEGIKTYGSTYLPFNISHVDGAQAYIGCKLVKNCMTLNAVDDFARATGVVLISDECNNIATLTIGGESANDSSVISGTLTQQVIADSLRNHYLIFDMQVIYRPGYMWVPAFVRAPQILKANTAYFCSETGSTIYLDEWPEDADKPKDSENFPISDINEVEKKAPNAQSYYDLSGRRVIQPVKGGVYIQRGKKVVVR